MLDQSRRMAPPVWLKGSPESDIDTEETVRDDPHLDHGTGGSRLVCILCGNEVTRTGARTSVNGSHRHVFCNPGGYVYEIGCFSSAPGCLPSGIPTDEFTWFPGHAWQIGTCTGCGEQLGWRFSSESGSFFGLILDRLSEADERAK